MSEPIITQAFNYKKTVICGSCKHDTEKQQTCKLCGGTGTLIRITKGTVELYQSDYKPEVKK